MVIQTLLSEIVAREEDFTEGDLFSFLFYKQYPSVVIAVKNFPEVQPYIFIAPLSSSLGIPEIIKRLKDLLQFEVNAMKHHIMEAFANHIRLNRVKHELLYQQLEKHSKEEKNPYIRRQLLSMIEYIKRPEVVVNPFENLSL